MVDFSDKSSVEKPFRIPMTMLLSYIEETRVINNRKPPRRFRTPKSERGIKFEERSLSTTRVRQRLCDLMGTDVIRLNDKRYFQKLSERLQEEYETIMNKQEEARVVSEQERLHRLMLEGVIEDPNDYRAIVYGQSKIKPPKKTKRKITHNNAVNEANQERHENEVLFKSKKEGIATQMEIMSGSWPTTSTMLPENGDQTKPSQTNVAEGNEEAQKTKDVKEMHDHARHHKRAALRPTSNYQSPRDVRRVQSAAPRLYRIEKESSISYESADDTISLPDKGYIRKSSRFTKQEPERIAKLRNEETVAGLYSIAEELVCQVRTDVTADKKGKKPF